jgi:hypothetical protein
MSLPGFWWILRGLPAPSHSLIQVSSLSQKLSASLEFFVLSFIFPIPVSTVASLLLFYISCGFRLGTAAPSTAIGSAVT